MTTFQELGIRPALCDVLRSHGIKEATPVQEKAMPLVRAGHDCIVKAQTGTGKTLAFLLPIIEKIKPQAAVTQALVITPTRELAIQIDKDFRNLGRHTGLKGALIYGGVDYDKQRELLRGGVDIIIATPGRLLDYFKQQVFSLRAVDVFIIDEADRMFDLGFIKDVRFLFRRLPPREQRQGMLFSATLSYRVLELAYEHMNEPEKLTVEAESVTAARVRQLMYFPSTEEKMPLLLNLLEQVGATRSIVFVNTKAVAERVSDRLTRHGFRVGALSGDVPQKKREKLLERFQKGEVELIVATDVAARGLHIPAVSHVFNYDLPQDAEDYVHRIGRTARLGAEGDAISFACDLYAQGLPDIETYIEQKIPTAPVTPGLLVPPPRRAQVTPLADDAEDAAHEAAGEEGWVSPAELRKRRGEKPGKGRSHGGHGGRGQGGKAAAPRGERREGSAGKDSSKALSAEAKPARGVAVAPAGSPAREGADGEAPRKRRRRGGRGRRREAGETVAERASPTPRTGERAPAGLGSAPAVTVDVPARTEAKPSLFRRLTRFLGFR